MGRLSSFASVDRGGAPPQRQSRGGANYRSATLRLGKPRLALVSCPRASGNFGVDYSGWDEEAFEQFPNVMPYTVTSMAWSAKRKRMRTKETQAWQEEMDNLKSRWAGSSASAGRASNGRAAKQADETTADDWHWCSHADAVRKWEEEKLEWATNRERAFRVAQQRLNAFHASQQAASPRQPTLPNCPNPDPQGFYSIMGISSQATLDDVKRAFRVKAKDLHPDVARGSPTDERMKVLLRAYAVLKDPVTRDLYDRGLAPKSNAV